MVTVRVERTLIVGLLLWFISLLYSLNNQVGQVTGKLDSFANREYVIDKIREQDDKINNKYNELMNQIINLKNELVDRLHRIELDSLRN